MCRHYLIFKSKLIIFQSFFFIATFVHIQVFYNELFLFWPSEFKSRSIDILQLVLIQKVVNLFVVYLKIRYWDFIKFIFIWLFLLSYFFKQIIYDSRNDSQFCRIGIHVRLWVFPLLLNFIIKSFNCISFSTSRLSISKHCTMKSL